MTRPVRTRPQRTRRPRVTTLPQLIANAVETNPDGVALVLADGTGPLEQVSYADLDAWSSRLARALIARGIGPEDLVAVAIPRSLDAVLAVWAVAKTGAGFVPIDPAYPPGWVAHLLVDAGAVYGLAVSWVRNELPEEIEWLQVDTVDTARALEQFSADAVTYADRVRPLRAEHPAYVTYVADGETLPDGVVVTQTGLSGLCGEQQGRYRVEPDDRTLNFAPLPSDSSVLELLLALGGAATMVVVSPLVSRADELAALLRRTGVTHAYLPADALELIDPAGLDELGVVIAGRRPCPPETVQRWVIPVTGGSVRALYQGYGPAEVTVMTGISSPLVPGGPLTLGAPIRGVTAHILDEQLTAVPDGAVGELYLGGLQLARGYHRRPGRTAQLLIADPSAADGSRLYRTGDLVRRGSGGAMEYVGRVELPALEGPAVISRPSRGEPAVAAADEHAVPPENFAASGRQPADELPDYEQSLPIRDPADPGRQVRDADPTASRFGPSGADFGSTISAPHGSDPVPGDSPEPLSRGHGFAGPDRLPLDSSPEKGSRLASEQRDMELTGRGYLEMPDRQQTLPGRGARSAAEPFEPAVADSPGPGLYDAPGIYGTPETAGPGAAERADRGEPADSGLSQPGSAAAPDRHQLEDSTDDWLRSGRQLPGPPGGPGDPVNQFPAATHPSPDAAAALPVRGGPAPIPSDATAFYEHPLSTGREPDHRAGHGPAVAGPAQPLSDRPDWAVPPAWSAEPELPSRSGIGTGAPSDPDEIRPAGPPNLVERPATIPLSPGQLRLWERNQTAPGTTVETITAAMRLTGPLDVAAMQAAVADVVDRHETLRTVYPAAGAAPQQLVLPREQAVPEVVAEPVPAADLGEWLHALSQTDFDAADAEQVPVRFALAELGPREHVVAVVVHRILADDVSAGLLLRDLLRAFLGRRNRSRPLWQPLSIQYLDYFLGRRAELGDIADPDSLAARRLAYWREYLSELPPRLELPADTAAAAPGEGVHAFDIGTRTHRRIADIAQRAGTSEFIVLRAAFAVLLARSAASADIVLGSSVRGSDERELDDAIGPYANTVVLRTRIDPAESFLDLVQRVAESDRRAFANADLPFELLTAALGIDGPLFDVSIALRHNDIPRLEMPSLATEPVEVPTAPVGAALRLVIDPHRAPDGSPDGIAAAFRFAADRLGRTAVTEIARRFQRVLTVAGGDPDGPVGDIDLLSRADLDRLLVVWNDTRYPVAPELVLDGYRRTVAIRPDTVAVADAETELSYQEFDGRVNRLARRLIEAGVGAETVVGIATRCTPDLVVAIYAVLTAGGAYLPLDPRDPAHWTAQVLDTATPALVLADRASESRAAEAVRASGQPAPVLLVDSDELGQYSTEPVRSTELARAARPGNAACVMCVSAAADGPELAVLSHTALNNQITLMLAQTPLGFTDVYLQRNAATAATSLWGFFLPLRAGAELVLTGPANTRQIAEAVTAHGVTVTDFGPAELAEFAELIDPDRVGSLREIFVTGEPLSPEIVSALRARCGAQVHNLYGTCETAVSATSWPAAGSAERSVPIGLPQWNTRVYVLDSRLRPVPPGVPGELYLAGDQLARGYAGRAALTADRFVANPFGYGQRMYRTGDLVLWRDATHTTPQRLDLLGRTDHQIRFRGHRLRPHIIAAALRTLPGITDAAILARTVAAGSDPTAPGSRLAVYVVPEHGSDPDLDQVRAGLARLLPASLLPVAYQAVEQIPLNSAGEPDGDRLPDPDEVPALTTALEPGPAESVAQLDSRNGEPATAGQTSTADAYGTGDAHTASTHLPGRADARTAAADVGRGTGAAPLAGDVDAGAANADLPGRAGVRATAADMPGRADGAPADVDAVDDAGRGSAAADMVGGAGGALADADVVASAGSRATAAYVVRDADAATVAADRGGRVAGGPANAEVVDGADHGFAAAGVADGSAGGSAAAGVVGRTRGESPDGVDAIGDAAGATAADALGRTGSAGRPDGRTISGADNAAAIGAGARPGDSAAVDPGAAEHAGPGVRSGFDAAEGTRAGEDDASTSDAGTSRKLDDAAAVSESPRGPAAEGESSGGSEVSGELPATPTVIRLLENPLPGVEVRSIVLDLPADRPLDHTEAVVRALVTRHPLLSARLDSSDRSPTLWIPPRDQRGDRQYWWLGPESGENTVATDDVVQAAADALDPATGRNIHFVVTGAESARRLVVVANGLVVDDRSWRVIVDELIAGDTAPAASETRLPQLIQALDQRARSIDLLDEAGWWRRNLAGARTAAPLGTVDLRARRRVSLAITAEGTAAVTAAADAYQATVPEVLLTAVAIALRTGEQGAVVRALGSLVRYDADARSLVSRSDDLVGGFATEFPLSVQVADIDTADALVGGPAAGAALTQIRDLVRSVPGGGAGYALLRYLSAETSAEFAAADSGRFTLRYRDLRPARVHTDGPADGVPLVLTVDVTDDGLLCRFDYATEVFLGEDVKTFAEHWVRALGGLAEHGLRPTSPDPAPQAPTVPDPYAPPVAVPGATAEPDSYAPPTADSYAAAGPDLYAPPTADSYAAAGPDSYTPQTTDPYASAEYETADSGADASASPDRQPPAAAHSPAEDRSDDRAWQDGGAVPQGLADREPLPDHDHDPHAPVPDAEVTSLLRPITDPPHPPVGSGLPQRRRRTSDPAPDAPEPAADALPQREPANIDRARTAAGPGQSVLPQRRPRLQDSPVPPESSTGSGLPQRRPQIGAQVAGAADQRPEASTSGATERPLVGAEPGDSTDQAGEVSRLRASGLPQRRPQAAGEAGTESRRPEISLSGPAEPSGSGEEPGDFADPRGEAAGVGPGGLPQRRPRSRDDSPSPAGPGLPQRRPEAGDQAAESGDHPEAPAPGPGVPLRAGEESPGLSPSADLPQRQPRLHDGPLLPESSSSSELPQRGRRPAERSAGGVPTSGTEGLPQRSRQSAERSAGGAPTFGTDGLPQRQSRAEDGVLASEPPTGSALPQRSRSQNGSASSEPPVDSGLPQRQPGGADHSLPPEPVRGQELPQRRPLAEEQLASTGDEPPESPLAGLVDMPQVGADFEGSRDEVAGRGANGLPQRRPGLRDGAGSGDSAPSSLTGLPQRRPGRQGGPDSSEQPVSPRPGGLPQRRPQLADHSSDKAYSENSAQEQPATGADAQEAAPAAGPVSLPQRRPAQVEEPAERGQTAEPPQRRPEPGGGPAPEAAASLPQRRPELAAAADGPASESLDSRPGGEEAESTADPEPTTFLRPVTDVETTAYLSPIRDLGPREDENTLLSLFDAQVARTPADPAVRQGARLLSYVELDRKSRALSVELIRFGVGAQTPVAVAMRPGIDLVVAVCAVLRAGGAYVPVDPGGSAEDLDRVLASAEPICVLSISDDGVTTGTGIPVVAIDLLYLDLPTDPAADPVVAADDIADIRYRPDVAVGVAGTHRQMVERLRRAQRSHPYDSADLVLHAAPTVGDITLWELFRPLHSGAQILMPDHPGRAADLSRSIAAHKVTVVHVVPALLDRFLDSVTDGGGRAAHPSLRRLVVDGAALPSGGVERFMNLLPGAELVIWYGHNETGVITVGSVGGRPVTNDRVYLLDEQLRPVPPGTAGEMYIGGPQLARGFYDAPGDTAVHFVAAAGGGRLYRTGDIVRRRDGVLEYLGRTGRHGGSLPVGSRRGGHD
ncbi:AMP-binding protein [Nocardia carnea]|uniref:AMP-binding protein n=1 Tax=Nocardia carnea TaxID=37328 RepID=UPI002455BAB8|nr:AMP-binding protein [Nocardia carnea]